MKIELFKGMGIILGVLFLFMSTCYGQNNTPDPLVNLALAEDAVVSGNAPEGGRGIPEDILWDPAANDWATESAFHEYGMAYNDIMVATKDDPLYWQVIWETEKNVNYITCSGVYPNQPQPFTGWSVQILVDSIWQDLAKAHNGWDADTVRGAGVGIPTQTNWVWDGQLVWRGLEPVVTRGIRLTAYANPESVDDGEENFADSLWSFAWSGRDLGPGTPKAALIQYLDFSEEAADNQLDPLVNLALLDEAVVSADFTPSEHRGRGQPTDILYDPVRDDYHNKNTPWGEFGYAYDFVAGYPEGPDDGFQYIVEWPVPKKINYITWGGGYGAQPQPATIWALQYWSGNTWETLINGVGGAWYDPDYNREWPYTPGIDMDAQSIWMASDAEAISTTKIRLAAWSDGFTPLWSFHIRCRGGACKSADDSDNPFKAVLVQFAEIHDPTAIETVNSMQPNEFALDQNYPNPFNPKTIINYELPARSAGGRMTNYVDLSIYNTLGQKIATLVSEQQGAGTYQVEWDASGFASGVYYYRLSTDGGFVQSRKLLLLK